MTSPFQDPSGTAPAERPAPAPASRGWVSAHALDSGRDAGLRPSLEPARAAADAFREAPADAETDAAWNAFAEPFLAARENADRIREPVWAGAQAGPKGAERLAAEGLNPTPIGGGIGSSAATGLTGFAKPAEGAGAGSGLDAIGALAALAANGLGSPLKTRSEIGTSGAAAGAAGKLKPSHGTWVETGNPTVRGSALKQPAAAPAKPASRPKPKPIAPYGFPVPESDRPNPPLGPSPMEAWMEKTARKLKEYAQGKEKGPKAPVPKAAVPPAASPRRAPFLRPEDPETLERFKRLLAALPADPGSASSTSGNTVTPVSPIAASGPGDRGPTGPDLPETAGGNDVTPVRPPFPAKAPDSGFRPLPADPAGAPGRQVPPAAPIASPSRSRAEAEVEWLEEEDDLAAKLHRLLRRQAKRRGVDLP